MTSVNDTVFGILRESLFGQPFDSCTPKEEALGDADLQKVFAELRVQTVLCFADKWMERHRPKSDLLYEKWRVASRDCQIRVLYIMSAQQKLLELLDANGIESVIIKGAAAACYYPDPFLRMMGDIDFLVKRDDFERTAKLLENNGYERRHERSVGTHYHIEYKKYGITFELHRRLPIVDENNEELLRLFENGVENSVRGRMDRLSFPMLPHALNGIVLLFHINQHLRVGLGLRQILDWMMFVDGHIDDEAWAREYRSLFESVKMDRFAKIVTETCKRRLGLRKDITWCADADPQVCDGFIDYIMEKGNFGVKGNEESRVSSVFLRTTNPFKIIAKLQKKGRAGWKKAQKYPLLRPLAWLYALNNEIKSMRNSKISVAKMNALKNEGLKQRAFIESLGLDADNKIYELEQ